MPKGRCLQIVHGPEHEAGIARFRRGGHARGLPMAQYLVKLVELHQAAIDHHTDPAWTAERLLAELDLAPITV